MFESKKCVGCNEPIKKDFEFCPSCGTRLKDSDEEFGMLGRNDQVKMKQTPCQIQCLGD